MESGIKLIYWSIGAIIFVIAVSILFYSDRVMEEEYRNILYTDKYYEITNNLDN